MSTYSQHHCDHFTRGQERNTINQLLVLQSHPSIPPPCTLEIQHPPSPIP